MTKSAHRVFTVFVYLQVAFALLGILFNASGYQWMWILVIFAFLFLGLWAWSGGWQKVRVERKRRQRRRGGRKRVVTGDRVNADGE